MADSLGWLQQLLGGYEQIPPGGTDLDALQYYQEVLSGRLPYRFDRAYGLASPAPELPAVPPGGGTRLEMGSPAFYPDTVVDVPQPTPPAPEKPALYPDVQTTPFEPYSAPSSPDTGQGTALDQIMTKLGDIGTAGAGLTDRLGLALGNLLNANVWLGREKPRGSEIPVMPGMQAAADAATFLTGGLSNTLFPAAGTLRTGMQFAAPVARETAQEAIAAVPRMLADQSGALRVPPRRAQRQQITLDRPLPAVEPLPEGEVVPLPGHNLASGLRAAHLARTDPLPLAGPQMKVVPPPHIQTEADMDRLVRKYADYALAGQVGKPWYQLSGEAISEHAGTPELATPFAAGLARTSPQTDVLSNLAHALTAHNQALVGAPIRAGRFPNDMGRALENIYYGGETVSGEKIGPFMGAVANKWAPDMFPHMFVNDIWNMRALEYPGQGGKLYEGSPSFGQHNFARIVADRAADILRRETGQPWTLEEVQASGWGGIKQEIEKTTAEQAAFNFADALKRNYAQLSWEAAPGVTTGHFPELHTAPWDLQQAYHKDILKALTDDQGRDVIASHFGALTGRTFEGPGYFRGKVAPGAQSPIAVGQAPGGALQGVDPASKELLDTMERVRGILLRQDAVAWHKPIWTKNVPVGRQDLADFDLGRPLTRDETLAVAAAMREATGTDFFSPIATTSGFRFQNVPEASGLANKAFQEAARKAMQRDDILPGAEVKVGNTATDGNYIENNWGTKKDGEAYRSGLAATRSPDLQRRAAELLATLGPRVADVDARYARDYGWTQGSQRRFWEEPAYQDFKLDVIPAPPRPGDLRRSAEADPNWRPLFGPGSILGGLGAGLMMMPGGAEASPPQQNPASAGFFNAPRNSLEDIMRMLGAR